MKEVAYISTSQGLVFDDDVLTIVRTSQANNARLGVTGLLCYDGVRFMQIIEGDDATVDELYGQICADPRHTNVRTLSDRPIEGRAFSDWSLGYKRVVERLRDLGILDESDELAVPSEQVGGRIAEAFLN